MHTCVRGYRFFKEIKMEITKNEATFYLNPRRICYIEYFLADEGYPYYGNRTYSPYRSEAELEKIKENSDIDRFGKFIKIIMTDGKEFFFSANDDDFDEITQKLEKIIGG